MSYPQPAQRPGKVLTPTMIVALPALLALAGTASLEKLASSVTRAA